MSLRRIIVPLFVLLGVACNDAGTLNPAMTQSPGAVPEWTEPGAPGHGGDWVKQSVKEQPPQCLEHHDSLAHGGAATGTLHDNGGLPRAHEPCFADQECDDGDACTIDTCSYADHTCVHQAGNCCQSALECDDGNECTQDVCAEAEGGGRACHSAPIAGCCMVTLSNTLSAAADVADWGHEPTNPGVGWQIAATRYVSPPASLYLGDPKTGTYINHHGDSPAQPPNTEASIAAPVLRLDQHAASAVLDLQLWVDVESCDGHRAWFDIFRIVVDTPEVDSVVMFDKCDVSDYRTWVAVSLDLTPFIGDLVGLRLDFNSIDARLNDGEGIYVDDLQIMTCY